MNIPKQLIFRTPFPSAISRRRGIILCTKRDKDSSRGVQRSVKTTSSTPSLDLENLSYKVITGLAGLGCLETIYLTLSKFLNHPVVCLANGCEAVLTSEYSEIYGVPISLFGFLGYSSMIIFAMECERSSNTFPYKNLLVSSTSVMAASSTVLIFTLMTKLDNAFCLWCYLSAFFSVIAFLISLTAVKDDEKMSVLMPSTGMAFVCSFALLTVFNQVNTASATDLIIDYQDPVVTTESDEGQIKLARRLKEAGVKMFGAFWCNHCYDQKQAFGKEAMEYFPYVECYPNGYRKAR
eukprot:g7606.t1